MRVSEEPVFMAVAPPSNRKSIQTGTHSLKTHEMFNHTYSMRQSVPLVGRATKNEIENLHILHSNIKQPKVHEPNSLEAKQNLQFSLNASSRKFLDPALLNSEKIQLNRKKNPEGRQDTPASTAFESNRLSKENVVTSQFLNSMKAAQNNNNQI